MHIAGRSSNTQIPMGRGQVSLFAADSLEVVIGSVLDVFLLDFRQQRWLDPCIYPIKWLVAPNAICIRGAAAVYQLDEFIVRE